MKLHNIAFGIIILFSVVGFLTIGLTAHELFHYYDFKNVSANGNICLFNFPVKNVSLNSFLNSPLGYYKFDAIADDSKIMKYTEIKAYGISLLIFIVFLACFYISIKRWFENGNGGNQEQRN